MPRPAAGPGHQTTSAAEFDRIFSSEADVNAFSDVVRQVDPALPEDIEPFSFLCSHLLEHVLNHLDLHPHQLLADLGCGRGGPGLWLMRRTNAALIGIDFSTVALEHARARAADHAADAQFLLGDFADLPLDDQSVDRAVSLDALQYAEDRIAAARQVHRILRPAGRLVLTGWHPRTPGDHRLPSRHRTTDWPQVLHAAGFVAIACHDDPVWDTAYQAIYRTALAMNTDANPGLASLQGEARRRLATAHLLRRVAITATRS
jgi:ubiquinone/menaquinone biosynthesis C-methylase UbiE